MDGLHSGRSYSFRVRASNERGQSSWSETASAATLPAEPSPCLPPSFAARTASSIRVRWEAPSEDGGATITSYRQVNIDYLYSLESQGKPVYPDTCLELLSLLRDLTAPFDERVLYSPVA